MVGLLSCSWCSSCILYCPYIWGIKARHWVCPHCGYSNNCCKVLRYTGWLLSSSPWSQEPLLCDPGVSSHQLTSFLWLYRCTDKSCVSRQWKQIIIISCSTLILPVKIDWKANETETIICSIVHFSSKTFKYSLLNRNYLETMCQKVTVNLCS